ncbi:hypothetical protein LTR78_006441 [Recurvomyces mirabilis]|uniref:MINDY deubiquitinase domain-containing protein n=1 Tax=Recurvomyces mirabilis TaxID=574656 RepID=A0AAE1BZU9_9PEZI|nr:hypothetical protein LTR78_006441 [Recurvomyces mirabilis]KAK5151140.1 hypothetical protein LTS14_009636 [Recurvomyces mirabilis]
MVTRKPVGPPLNTTQQSPEQSNATTTTTTNPPYPTTPTAASKSPVITELDRSKTLHSIHSVYSPDLNSSPAFDLIDMNQARQRPRRDSDVSSHGTWDSDEDHEERMGGEAEERKHLKADLPKPLRITKSQQDIHENAQSQGRKDELPAILKPGPAAGAVPIPRKSEEISRYEDDAQANPWATATAPVESSSIPNGQTRNPYRQVPSVVPEMAQGETWQFKPALLPTQPSNAPPPPPVEISTSPRTPADELSQMSLNAQPHKQERPQPQPFETTEILAVPQSRPPPPSVVDEDPPETNEFYSNNPWRSPSEGEVPQQTPNVPPPALPKVAPQHYAPPPGPPPKAAASTSLIDHQSPPSQAAAAQARPAPIATLAATATIPTDSIPETPGTRDKRQRSEHYQIKHINWTDTAHGSALRRSPILTQNANGPCPLLALVNALILSTPQDMHTALVETLSTREQVSLGLLLDAVFDELMSERRSDAAQGLPDVGELYAFLLALHTGMNVNPRFVTPAKAPRGSLDNPPSDKTNLHSADRAQTKAGAFEETREMRLYSTFNVPLIHGWTAPRDTPAYTAFERCAPTFEEAQNVQFLESELEDKLRSEGLPPNEQRMLDDIKTIKLFLNTWPTQLTDYGLETISSSLQPGQIAILFRNDHFSTLYKEPRHGALMTLVTDTGYSGHDEIVWESLIDVNGAASEIFSGDFRVVGDAMAGQSQAGEQQWQNAGSAQHGATSPVAPPLPGPRPQHPLGGEDTLFVPRENIQRTTSEQEDHDLALALQLQEEEEDQQRQAESRRRREQALSEQFLSTETPASPEGPRPPIPPRRSGNRASQAPTGGRPPVTRVAGAGANTDPDAPPTYEQSASDRPYRPAGATAQAGLQQGNPLNAYDALRRQQAGFAGQSSGTVNNIPSSPTPGNGGFPGGSGPGNRRPGQGPNQVRRRSSQLAPPGSYGSGMNPAPGGGGGGSGYGLAGGNGNGSSGSGGAPPGQGRPGAGQAAGLKDAEDKCVVM